MRASPKGYKLFMKQLKLKLKKGAGDPLSFVRLKLDTEQQFYNWI